MRDQDLDRLIRDVDPLRGIAVHDFDLADGGRELLEELTAPEQPASRPASARGRRVVLRLAFVTACLAVATVAALLVFGSTGDGGGDSAYAKAVEVAKANRRLLVTQRGWSLDYAQWDSPTYGEVEFVPRGGRDSGYLDMNWYPADELASRTRPDGRQVTIAGVKGITYRISDDEFVAVLPPRRGNFLLIRGSARNAEDFQNRTDSIVSVSVAEWLEAMPDSVVKPADQSKRIDELLQGVPLPDGFDRSVLAPADMPQDDYQFDAYVLRGAYCGWLDEWWRADKAGDEAAANFAIEQLLGAENWPAVRAQAKAGSLDQDFRQYANQVADGYGDKRVYDQMENCIEYP